LNSPAYDQATSTAWLTGRLQQNGFLDTGKVVEANANVCSYFPAGETYTSRFFHLELTYTEDCVGRCPRRVLLKVGKPDLYDWNRHEVQLYEILRHAPSPSFAPTSYGSLVNDSSRETVLLLEDNGQDHVQETWPIPPDPSVADRVVRSLAQLHAAWWNSPRFNDESFDDVRGAKLEWLTGTLRSKAAETFLTDMSGKISPERVAVFRLLIEKYPDAVKRRVSETNYQTLVRGDNHLSNVLIPTSVERDVVFVDWQQWGCDFGAWDLADFIAQTWYPDWRSRNEAQLLDTYARTLRELEIEYPDNELWFDYRLQVPALLASSIESYSGGKPAVLWWPNMECTFATIDDLDCLSIID
jgi:hypothetical protein